MMDGTITQKKMISSLRDVVVQRRRAMNDHHAGHDPQGPLGGAIHGATTGGPPPGGRTYCLAASTMQKRAAGMASRRAAPIGLPQTWQTP